MKAILLLPPVVALAIAGTLLSRQHQLISTLEEEITVLRKAIAARSSGSSASDPTSGKPASAIKLAKDKEPLDWKKIAAQFAELRSSGGMGDMRAMIHFQQRLQAMTKEELIAAFDEIAALDVPAESRQTLEQMLLGPLVQKDPELTLTKFIDRIQGNEGSMSYQLSNAMQEWAKKDPTAAIAWFDRQIAAGKFDSKSLDGKSETRIQFEGELINVLIGSDPDAAARRLAAMPEDQRDEVLSRFSFQQLKEDDQLAFAKLVRNHVPKKDQAETLARQASRLVKNNDYSKVTKYLDGIQATPAERIACVEDAAESQIRSISYKKKITREDLNTMRTWIDTESPESTGSITGKVLANAAQGSRKMEFSEAAALAEEYNTAAGDDQVLSAFLDGYPALQNKDQARVLAEKIVDAKRREEILKKLK